MKVRQAQQFPECEAEGLLPLTADGGGTEVTLAASRTRLVQAGELGEALRVSQGSSRCLGVKDGKVTFYVIHMCVGRGEVRTHIHMYL